jgi:hypothetical protein
LAESAKASALNSKCFLALSTSIVAYSAVDEFTLPSVLAAMVPQEKLFLRVGAQVMVIRCIEPYLPDGTIGKVIGFSSDSLSCGKKVITSRISGPDNYRRVVLVVRWGVFSPIVGI